MAIGEHYSLKLFGTILGQQWLNTFAYRQSAGSDIPSSAALSAIFESTIQGAIASLTGDYTFYDRIESFAIETPTDFDERAPANAQGDRVFSVDGTPPSFIAFGFRSNRAGAGSRASYKRFCGVGDTDFEVNTLTLAFLALIGTSGLQGKLGSPLVSGGGNVYVPVQLKAGWLIGVPPVENFEIDGYGVPYLTSQVSRRA